MAHILYRSHAPTVYGWPVRVPVKLRTAVTYRDRTEKLLECTFLIINYYLDRQGVASKWSRDDVNETINERYGQPQALARRRPKIMCRPHVKSAKGPDEEVPRHIVTFNGLIPNRNVR